MAATPVSPSSSRGHVRVTFFPSGVTAPKPVTTTRRPVWCSARAADVTHDHHAMSAGSRGLIDAASHCVEEAEICDQHCLAMFAQGDTTLAECAQRVRELATLCTAARQLAVQQSPRLSALLAVCNESCMACETECRKHEAKHAACKSCADACVGMIEAIKTHAA